MDTFKNENSSTQYASGGIKFLNQSMLLDESPHILQQRLIAFGVESRHIQFTKKETDAAKATFSHFVNKLRHNTYQ